MALTSKSRQQFDEKGAVNKKEWAVDEIMAQGRLLTERAFPYFIPAIRGLSFVESPECPTMAVDKWWRLYYNPGFVKFLMTLAKSISPTNPCHTCGATQHHPLAFVAGVICHESWHVTQNHLKRFENTGWTNRNKFNVVADLEMNDDIPEAASMSVRDAQQASPPRSMPLLCIPTQSIPIQNPVLAEWIPDHMKQPTILPNGKPNIVVTGLMPKMFKDLKGAVLPDGRTFEWYYENIGEDELCEEDNSVAIEIEVEIDGDGDGQGQGEGDGEAQAEGQGDGQGDGEGQGQGKGKGGKKKIKVRLVLNGSDHGSGVDGEIRPWEGPAPDGKSGSKMPGLSEAEQQAVRREVAQKIKQSNGRGNMPGGFSVWADTTLAPSKRDWRKELRANARVMINRVAGEKFNTYRRPSRASLVHNFDIIKPATYDIRPTVVVVVDTSGSMGSGARSRLERALSEAEAVVKLCRGNAYFLDCDANVYGAAQQVSSVRSAKVHGGGGTDQTIGVRAAAKNKPKADVIIMLTDGDTPYPTKADAGGAKLIICICNESDHNVKVAKDACPWAEVCWVDTE